MGRKCRSEAYNQCVKVFTCSCLQCSREFTVNSAYDARKRKFCSRGCAARSQWKDEVWQGRRYRFVGRDHPLSNGNRCIQEQRAILWDRIGPGPHTCHYCGEEVNWRVGIKGGGNGALIAEHKDRDPRNNSPENLVPSCQRCNILNCDRIIRPDELTVMKSGRKRRAVERECQNCGTTFRWVNRNAANRGKYCTMACYRASQRAGASKPTRS